MRTAEELIFEVLLSVVDDHVPGSYWYRPPVDPGAQEEYAEAQENGGEREILFDSSVVTLV